MQHPFNFGTINCSYDLDQPQSQSSIEFIISYVDKLQVSNYASGLLEKQNGGLFIVPPLKSLFSYALAKRLYDMSEVPIPSKIPFEFLENYFDETTNKIPVNVKDPQQIQEVFPVEVASVTTIKSFVRDYFKFRNDLIDYCQSNGFFSDITPHMITKFGSKTKQLNFVLDGYCKILTKDNQEVVINSPAENSWVPYLNNFVYDEPFVLKSVVGSIFPLYLMDRTFDTVITEQFKLTSSFGEINRSVNSDAQIIMIGKQYEYSSNSRSNTVNKIGMTISIMDLTAGETISINNTGEEPLSIILIQEK